MNGAAKITVDLFFELENEEFNRELGHPEEAPINKSDIINALVEQVEEAIKESGNGSSLQLSMGMDNTEVRIRID